MRLSAALVGDLREEMRDEVRNLAPPLRRALRAAGDELKVDLRAHTEDAGLGKLGRTWRHRHFRGRPNPFDMASFVFPAGRSARRALAAFDQGVEIRPKNAKYLAIPTQFNRKTGRRGGRVLVKPDEIKDGFVRRSKKGTLILFARVSEASAKSRGRVRRRAFVNTTQSGTGAAKLLGSGRVRRSEAILEAGAVPMFVLVPKVNLRKRIDIDRIAEKALNALPARVVREMEIENAKR